jgi:TnpA family transposase
MPRRRAITDARLDALLALPTVEPDLIRHYTLSPADLAVIARRRRPHNRLGFALQLCALRYPGRLLRPGEVVPRDVLVFVADQLDLPSDGDRKEVGGRARKIRMVRVFLAGGGLHELGGEARTH